MRPVVVRKLNLTGEETWRYTGEVLAQNPERIILEAYFNRNFARRWYNIFEIHDKDDDHLKCWYCNVTFPAEISDVQISYVDLALDLLVFPGGKYMVLDEDEFAALPLDATSRAQAFSALNELKKMAALNQLSPVLF
jgi:predicted RNA-binding protein associated with RNAse of E/G family